MSIIFTKYMSLLQRRPLATKCITSAFLVGLGDTICQGIECKMQGKMEFDFQRTLNFMAYGLLANGPALHLVYSRIIPTFAKGNDMISVGKKLLFTQTIFSGISISSFYIFVSQLEGKDLEGTKDELKNKLVPTFKTNLYVWPLLQLINFTCVPIHLQVLYVNFMQIWWNAYLSFMKNQTQMAEASDDVNFETKQIEIRALTRQLKSVKAFENQAVDDEVLQQRDYLNVETVEPPIIQRNLFQQMLNSSRLI